MPALVLIHGFLGSPGSYRRVLEELPADTRVALPVLLGHAGVPFVGRAGDFAAHLAEFPESPDASAKPSGSPASGSDDAVTPNAGPASFEAELDRLLAWLQQHDLERGLLVGYSLGARIALGLAVRAPERFSHAILVGVHPGLTDERERSERLALDERRAQELERGSLERFVDEWERLPLFASQTHLDERERAEQRRIRLSHTGSGLARSLRRVGLGCMPDWRSALAPLPVPVDLVVGARDEKFLALARGILPSLPHGELHLVPAAGHNVLLERPQFLVHSIVRRLA